MTNKNDNKRFLCYELGLLSLKAALSTRKKHDKAQAST